MIGTWVQPRRPRITSTPSMPGRPRSRMTRSGCLRAASVERGFAGGREVDVVAAGSEIRAERAKDLRLVVDDEDPGHSRGLQANDHREPAAGSVLDLDRASHRLDEPLRDREAEPDTFARGSSRRAAGTGGTSARARLPARRGRGRRPHVDAAVDGPGDDPRSDPRRRVRPAALAIDVGERALEQPGVGEHRRAASSGTSTSTSAAAVAEAAQRGGNDLVEADRLWVDARAAPVWRRLMSSRLPTRAFRRSVSSSIVARNSCRASSGPVDVVLEEARHRRLDRGERRAEVVGDGREDRRPQLVGGGEAAGRRRLGLELLELERRSELAREGVEDAAVVLGWWIGARRERARGSRRPRPWSSHRSGAARRRRRSQSSTSSSRRRRGAGCAARVEAERTPQARRAELVDRCRAGEPARACGFGAGARALAPGEPRAPRSALTTAGDREEDRRARAGSRPR